MIFNFCILLFLLPAYCLAQLDSPLKDMNASAMVRYWGYYCEEHVVETPDGYYLQIQRLPRARNETQNTRGKPVIFLQHGLLASSVNWVWLLPNESLAYMLADRGYDVWLGNVRGNEYGLTNQWYTRDQKAFWHFTWDQMCSADLPAMVDYVLNATGQSRIFYTGHSQGTLIMFCALQNPDFAKKINTFFAFAPIWRLKYIDNVLRLLAQFTGLFTFYWNWTGKYSVGDYGWIKNITEPFCDASWDNLQLCDEKRWGNDSVEYQNINMTNLPVQNAHSPADTSLRNLEQYGQNVKSSMRGQGDPSMYDFGSAFKNNLAYKQPTPPMYNISYVNKYTIMFHSDLDVFADPRDVQYLTTRLSNYKIYNYTGYTHGDFVWSYRVCETIYADMINELNGLTGK